MPTVPFDFTNTKINVTYPRVMQWSGSDNVVRDGLGDPISNLYISGSLAVSGTLYGSVSAVGNISGAIQFINAGILSASDALYWDETSVPGFPFLLVSGGLGAISIGAVVLSVSSQLYVETGSNPPSAVGYVLTDSDGAGRAVWRTPQRYAFTFVSSSHTVGINEQVLVCSGSFVLNLLPSGTATSGKHYTIKCSEGDVTVSASLANNIDGESEQSVHSPNSMTVVADGTLSWYII